MGTQPESPIVRARAFYLLGRIHDIAGGEAEAPVDFGAIVKAEQYLEQDADASLDHLVANGLVVRAQDARYVRLTLEGASTVKSLRERGHRRK